MSEFGAAIQQRDGYKRQVKAIERELVVARQTIRSLQNARATPRDMPYVEELEKRLRMACEPCADCGHIDYRELDDVLDREGVTRYAALASSGSEREQLEAVDKALGPWEPEPGSETGCVGRVQTILNLKASREREQELMNALREIERCSDSPDAVDRIVRAALAPAVEEQR